MTLVVFVSAGFMYSTADFSRHSYHSHVIYLSINLSTEEDLKVADACARKFISSSSDNLS